MMRCDALTGPGVRLVRSLAVLAALSSPALAADQTFTPDQIQTGSRIYARNCSPCHGPRMIEPQGAFDLREFPPDESERFVRSVTEGKNQMPAWGGKLNRDDVAALWAYVMAGEKK